MELGLSLVKQIIMRWMTAAGTWTGTLTPPPGFCKSNYQTTIQAEGNAL